MSGTVSSLRALAGDALIAVGEAVRGGSPNLEIWPAMHGRISVMESDGPDQTKPIPPADIRLGLDELPDSALWNIAATVIATWVPLAEHLVEALRNRASHFAAVESDAAEQFLTPAHLHRHL